MADRPDAYIEYMRKIVEPRLKECEDRVKWYTQYTQDQMQVFEEMVGKLREDVMCAILLYKERKGR